MTLATLASQFKLVKLQFLIQLKKDGELPEYQGSMLHGIFGQALMDMSPQTYHVFYGEHADQQPKPYCITPSQDQKTYWKQGELLSFDVTLFGEATQFAKTIIQSWQLAAEKRTLWKFKIPFRLVSVASHTPTGLSPGIQVCTLADYLSSVSLFDDQSRKECALVLQTPMRLKAYGKWLRNAPEDYSFWVNLILRRLVQLSRFWAVDDDALFDSIYQQYQVRAHIHVQSIDFYEDWMRYSKSQKEFLPFGGIRGQVSFIGEVHYFLPLFKIAELIQIGSKTTFGLGKVQLIS